MQIVTNAIFRSKWRNETVTLRSDEMNENVDAVIDELTRESEDSVEVEPGLWDLWGRDVDGHEWRINVVRR